ncbi:DNA helicase [Tanacetum coccineum]
MYKFASIQGKRFFWGYVASSSIMSLLFPAGRTSHSRFKLPLELTDESLFHAKKKCQLGTTKLIDFIYDEATLKTPTAGGLQENAIMCRKNDTADAVNAKNLSSIEGHSKTLPLGIKRQLLHLGREDRTRKLHSRGKSVPKMDFQKYSRHETTGILLHFNRQTANMDINNIEYFNPLLKPVTVYRFSNFICETTKPYHQTLENKVSLKFGKITRFDILTGKESEFPEHHFEFIAYNQWHLKHVQLTSIPATHYYINPWIPEAEYAHTAFKEKYSLNPPLHISNYRFEDPEQEKTRNRQTLHTLLQQNPTSFKKYKGTNQRQLPTELENIISADLETSSTMPTKEPSNKEKAIPDNQDRDLVLRRKKERSQDYNNSFLGEYECFSLALDRDERKDEKEEIGSLETRSNNVSDQEI